MNIAVIGAGCGGQAIAGYAASKGHDVSLYNRSPDRIAPLVERPEIELVGEYAGKGILKRVGSDIGAIVEDADMIMVVTTATGHASVAKEMAPYLKDGQTIMLNPGRTFGSLEFAHALADNGCVADVDVAEANTLVYATRSIRPGLSNINGIKSSVAFSSFPYHRGELVQKKINALYPQFYLESDALATSIGNIGTVFHPTIMLFNKDKVLAGHHFDFYTEGVSEDVAAYMSGMDQERLAIAHALGVQPPSLTTWLQERYDLPQGHDLRTLLRENPVYQGIAAPTTLHHRYLFEDVPTGLVPLAQLGDALDINTPHIDALIADASVQLGKDFSVSGRTLGSLGLHPNSLKEDFSYLLNAKSIQELRREYVCQEMY